MDQTQRIESYINSESRNKIVIHKEVIPEIACLNVGYELASEIQDIAPGKRFAIRAQNKLDKLLNDATFTHDKYGKVLAICNLGILLEQELKIDFNSLIEKHSKDVCLFIQWDGEITKNKLYFLSKDNGIEINIKHISHIAI